MLSWSCGRTKIPAIPVVPALTSAGCPVAEPQLPLGGFDSFRRDSSRQQIQAEGSRMHHSGELLVKFNIKPFTLRCPPWGGTHRGITSIQGSAWPSWEVSSCSVLMSSPPEPQPRACDPAPDIPGEENTSPSAHQNQLKLRFIAHRQEREAPGVPRDVGLPSWHKQRCAACMAGGGDQRGPSSRLAPLLPFSNSLGRC